jgi:hypothetical protein
MDDVPIYDIERKSWEEAVEGGKLPEVEVSFDDLMARIRHIVLASRLRVGFLLTLYPFCVHTHSQPYY